MQKTTNGWQVLDEATGTLVYNYAFAPGASSNAFATRMPDGRMMVLSPPSRVDEGVFADVQDFGDVGALVVTNGFHHLGQREWRDRFPDAIAYAAPEAAARVAKKNPAAGTFTPLAELQPLLGGAATVRELDNTKCGELWAHVETSDGRVWFTSDVLANMPSVPKPLLLKLLFKWSGSAPGYRPFHLALQFIVKNRRETLRQLAEETAAAPPTVMVPAHGRILDDATVAQQTEDLLRVYR